MKCKKKKKKPHFDRSCVEIILYETDRHTTCYTNGAPRRLYCEELDAPVKSRRVHLGYGYGCIGLVEYTWREVSGFWIYFVTSANKSYW